MTQLSVNLNKIALVRNSRNSGIPSVTRAAEICIAAGADGITVHPRPDERHVRRSDVRELKDMLTVEFNIEGNPLEPAFLELVREIRPSQCTMVPDAREQLTSDHGWDLATQSHVLQPIIGDLQARGTRVSLFLDAEPSQMERAKAIGADRVELYTGPYAEEFAAGQKERSLSRYSAAAQAALDAGLGVNAGHDLNLENLGAFLKSIPFVSEVSIGHALIADALELGLSEAVKRYAAICRGAT